MNKEQMVLNLKQIKTATDEQLVLAYKKCISAQVPSAEKKLYEQIASAIETERKKRGASKTISSKPLSPTLKNTSTADAYENED